MAPEYENSEFFSSSPKSPTKLVFFELHSKGRGGGGGGGRPSPTGPKHMRRSHSGKLVRVKKVVGTVLNGCFTCLPESIVTANVVGLRSF
ncbi:hypothetical protein Cni_G02187 [Canna indica]|uniref:Uncharacterized protein n=1 Tax=Canna indica TaxID=4628 RepID=A0AAQ3Q215_9LILI|nr:hypothetical protein Cni_G02187 [Canna indica]